MTCPALPDVTTMHYLANAFRYCIVPIRIASVAFLLESWSLAAEPTSGGDAYFQAASDTMSTTRSHLAQGRARLKFLTRTGSSPTQYQVATVDGTYEWDDERGLEYFTGTNSRGFYSPDKPDAGLPADRVTWFRTSAEYCQHMPDQKFASRKSPPDPKSAGFHAFNTHLAWFCVGRDSDLLFEDLLLASDVMKERTSVAKSAGEVDLVMVTASHGYVTRVTIDMLQGGHVTAYTLQPPTHGNWARGTFEWKLHPATNRWYPALSFYEEYPNGQFTDAIYRREVRVSEYSPQADLSQPKLSFASWPLPVGTQVSITSASGNRLYSVGGRTASADQFERELKSAAEELKRNGFAEPGR